MRRENQRKQTAGSTAGITRVGIMFKELQPQNHAGIHTRESVMSYLLDWHQRSHWCRQKIRRSTSLW